MKEKISHLFIIDPIEKLDLALDTSFKLMKELCLKNHQVYIGESSDMYWVNGKSEGEVRARKVTFTEGGSDLGINTDSKKAFSLGSFKGIHMRKDPPYDMDYIGITWMLDTVRDKSRIYNSPEALRSLNEKLSIFKFPKYSSTGIFSANSKLLLEYLKKDLDGDGILKPIDLYGGRGVQRLLLNESNEAEILSILEDETSDGASFRLLQKFDKGVFEGEIRAFSIGGKSIAYCLKKPKKGNFLANTREGATLETYIPSKALRSKVDELSKLLLEHGVFLVGFDVISDHISEINITSPRLLQGNDDKNNYFLEMAEWIEEDIKKHLSI